MAQWTTWPASPSRLACLAAVTVFVGAHVRAADVSKSLLSFGEEFDMTTLGKNGADAVRVGTPKDPALRITTFAGGNWPGVTIPAPGGSWDLSGFEFISLDLRNVDTHDVDIFIRVDNQGANGRDNCIGERAGAQPDQRVTVTIPLKRRSKSSVRLFGMRGYPQELYTSGGIDPSRVVGIVLFTGRTPVSNTFEVRNVRAAGRYRKPAWAGMSGDQFFPFVDEFGQFIHKDWLGKTRSVEDLRRRRREEAARLARDAGPKEWDEWGGWAEGPTLDATGHFRVDKHAGKWYLVDPDGRLFFSTGLCCVSQRWATTMLDDRDGWFRGLPARDGPFKDLYFKHWKIWSGHYRGREPMAFDFSGWNVRRKYGAEAAEVYPGVIHKRLRRWGINTIANWSSGKLCRMRRTPYTETFWYNPPKLRDGKGGFPDMFDARFREIIDQRVSEWLKASHEDPWCIGYFVDNELPWGGEDTLAREALASSAKQAAKRELVRWAREKYRDVAALNAAWGTAFTSWDALASETRQKVDTAKGRRDLVRFNGHMARTYFRTIRDIIKRHAPSKLYLGCRCVGGAPDVVAAAVEYCDVVSYNRYCHSVRDMRLPGGHDAPTLIGEFHFGALDRGQFWSGLVSASDQAERASKYREYVLSALDNPQVVGVHWFTYGDEALTGRYDGENAQCGFVDVCDTPYEETVRAARAVGERMYRYRLDGR